MIPSREMDRQVDRQAGGQATGWAGGRRDGGKDRRMGGWTDGGMDGQTDGWTDRQTEQTDKGSPIYTTFQKLHCVGAIINHIQSVSCTLRYKKGQIILPACLSCSHWTDTNVADRHDSGFINSKHDPDMAGSCLEFIKPESCWSATLVSFLCILEMQLVFF